jgi:hypothetical protein
MRLLRAAALLMTAMLLLSVVASVPIEGAAQGGGDSAATDDGKAIESFEVEFTSATPENPDDVSLQWNLSSGAENVSTVHVQITNESGKPINVYKPGETAVSNPFDVSDRPAAGQGTDITVNDLSAVALSLKIPPGHCDRVDSVAVSVSDRNGSLGEPTIERPVNCTASPTGNFEVAIQDYDDELPAGENGSLTAAVNNTAGTKDSQEVRFRVGGTTVEQRNLTLAANETETLNVSYETTESDVGDTEIAVESDDDAANRTVSVTETPVFAVKIDEYDEQVIVGERVNVTAVIENTGATEMSQDVRFEINGTETEQRNLTLPANTSTTLTLSNETTQSDLGDIELTLKSEADRASRVATVTEAPTFAVQIVDSDPAVRAGEHANVTAEIENTAATAETQTVQFLVNGTTIQQTTLTLSPNGTETMNVSSQTNETDAGSLEIAVKSEDDAAVRTVAIEEPAFFAVTITDAPNRVAAGDPVTVTALIENSGEYSALQNVTLNNFDGEVVSHRENLTLGPGESEAVTLQWSTEKADMGNGTISVSSENQTTTTGVVITEPTVDSITATLAATEMQETAETTIIVNASYTDGSTRTVTQNATLSAENQSVATVSDGGAVTAQSVGSVKIEALLRNKTDTASLTVTAVEDGTPGDSSDSDTSPDDGASGDTNNSTDDAAEDLEADTHQDTEGSQDADDGQDTDGSQDTDDGQDADDGQGADDSPGDEPPTENSTSDNPASGPADTDLSDSDGGDSMATPSDSEGTERTVIALFPVLGLVVLAPLVLANREWWFDY